MSPTDVRQVIVEPTAAVQPLDAEEAPKPGGDLAMDLLRAAAVSHRPSDLPPMHLAVYVALLDKQSQAVLLVDHIKAGLWLLPGVYLASPVSRMSFVGNCSPR
jgi:8-oxo-dGTP diphosphatase